MYSLTLDYMHRLLRLLAVIGGGFLLAALAERIRRPAVRWLLQGLLAGLVVWQCISTALLPFRLFSPLSAFEMQKDIYVFGVEHLVIFLLLLAIGLADIRKSKDIKPGDQRDILKRLSPVTLTMGMTGLLVFLGNEILLPTAFIANVVLTLALIYMLGVALYGLWQRGSEQLRQKHRLAAHPGQPAGKSVRCFSQQTSPVLSVPLQHSPSDQAAALDGPAGVGEFAC